jgi:hypothetical protein
VTLKSPHDHTQTKEAYKRSFIFWDERAEYHLSKLPYKSNTQFANGHDLHGAENVSKLREGFCHRERSSPGGIAVSAGAARPARQFRDCDLEELSVCRGTQKPTLLRRFRFATRRMAHRLRLSRGRFTTSNSAEKFRSSWMANTRITNINGMRSAMTQAGITSRLIRLLVHAISRLQAQGCQKSANCWKSKSSRVCGPLSSARYCYPSLTQLPIGCGTSILTAIFKLSVFGYAA